MDNSSTAGAFRIEGTALMVSTDILKKDNEPDWCCLRCDKDTHIGLLCGGNWPLLRRTVRGDDVGKMRDVYFLYDYTVQLPAGLWDEDYGFVPDVDDWAVMVQHAFEKYPKAPLCPDCLEPMCRIGTKGDWSCEQ